MKRFIAIIIIAALVLSFSACGGNSSDAAQSGTPGSDQTSSNGSHTDVSGASGDISSDGSGHVHSFGEWAIVKAPTCTEEGLRERICSCGEKESETMPASHTVVTLAAVPVGCITDGLTEGSYCSVCGEVLQEQTVIPAIGHDFSNGDCAHCGAEKPTEGLDFSLNDDKQSYTMYDFGQVRGGSVVIPDMYEGLPVTRVILPATWDWTTSFDSISIPETALWVDCGGFVAQKNRNIYNRYDHGYYLGNKQNPYYALVEDDLFNKEDYNSYKNVYEFLIHSDTKVTNDSIPLFVNAKTIVLPEGLKALNRFQSKSNLKSINIPESVIEINGHRSDSLNRYNEVDLKGCTELECAIYGGCKYLGNETNPYRLLVGVTDDSLESYEIHPDTKFLGASAFYGCWNVKTITIPKGITKIPEVCFAYCDSLTEVVILGDVTEIMTGAFYSCESLTSINLPESLRCIESSNGVVKDDYGVFEKCSSLVKISIPEGVTVIYLKTFCECSALETITLPATLKKIESYAFYKTGLTTIYYRGTEEQWNEISIDSANTSWSAYDWDKTNRCVVNAEKVFEYSGE